MSFVATRLHPAEHSVLPRNDLNLMGFVGVMFQKHHMKASLDTAVEWLCESADVFLSLLYLTDELLLNEPHGDSDELKMEHLELVCGMNASYCLCFDQGFEISLRINKVPFCVGIMN